MRISLLQDSPGLLAINGFALPPKIAEKRKIIEEIGHNDVKKVSRQTKKSLFRVCLCVFVSYVVNFDGNKRRQISHAAVYPKTLFLLVVKLEYSPMHAAVKML